MTSPVAQQDTEWPPMLRWLPPWADRTSGQTVAAGWAHRKVLTMKGGTGWMEGLAEGRYWLKGGTGYEGRDWLWKERAVTSNKCWKAEQTLPSEAFTSCATYQTLVYSLPAFVNHTLIKQRWPTLMLSKLALLVTSYSRSRAVKKALTLNED